MDLKDWLASRLTELGEELRRIDHDSSPQSRSVRHLYASGPGRFEGDVGKLLTDTCEVTVFYGDGTLPAEGTTVRFKVMDGPVRFSNGLTEITNTTDADGLAAVDLGFDQHGAGTVVADLEDGEGDAWFIGQSDQRTHDVHIFAPATVSAVDGTVQVQIEAVDHNEQPVVGAKFHLEAGLGKGPTVVGTVTEVSPGRYRGKLEFPNAGEWVISVHDLETSVRAKRCLHVLPGPADRFEFVGTTDPRASAPYGELLLRVLLVDAAGNPLEHFPIIPGHSLS